MLAAISLIDCRLPYTTIHSIKSREPQVLNGRDLRLRYTGHLHAHLSHLLTCIDKIIRKREVHTHTWPTDDWGGRGTLRQAVPNVHIRRRAAEAQNFATERIHKSARPSESGPQVNARVYRLPGLGRRDLTRVIGTTCSDEFASSYPIVSGHLPAWPPVAARARRDRPNDPGRKTGEFFVFFNHICFIFTFVRLLCRSDSSRSPI